MDIKLKRFNLLYESLTGKSTMPIVNEKKSNFFTKALLDTRYIEEDFELVWNGSGFKKLISTLSTALNNKSIIKDMADENLPEVDVEHMLDKKSATYEDLPAGTIAGGNIGIRLTYDIFDEYKYPLLKTLIARNEASESNTSNFGMFNDYLNKIVSDVENNTKTNLFHRMKSIKTDFKLEIIATPKNGKDADDFTDNKKHTKFSESGFSCTIFLWFDSDAFKKELIDLINDKNAAKPESTVGVDISKNSNSNTENELDSIDKINFRNSKIKLGIEELTINKPEIGNLGKLAKGLVSNNLASPIADIMNNKLGIRHIFGGKDNRGAEKGDKVRANKHFWNSMFNLGDVSNPYIYVVSKVTLDQWLYKDNFTKSASDTKNNKVNVAIQLRKPFNEKYLKVELNSPGKLDTNLSNGKNWTIEDRITGTESSWPNVEDISGDMEQYLLDIKPGNERSKKITCRWQYYLDSTRNMYSEYRVCIDLTDFYGLLNNITNRLNMFNSKITNIEDIDFNVILSQIKKNPKILLRTRTLSLENTEDTTYTIDAVNPTDNSKNTNTKDQQTTSSDEAENTIQMPNFVTNKKSDTNKVNPKQNNHLNDTEENGNGNGNNNQSISDFLHPYSLVVKFLNQSMDSTTNPSNGPAYGSHKNNFIFLDSLFNENTVLVKASNVRSIDYNILNLNNLFNSWWNKIYKVENEAGKKGNSQNTLITSNKHLYTNKGKAVESSVASITRSGIPGFKDYDGNAADYFISNVFNKGESLSINGTSLNDLFKEKTKNDIFGELNLDKAKEIFNNIKKFNDSLKTLLDSDIIATNKRLYNILNGYIILTEK